MPITAGRRLEPLGRWSSNLYLIAGVLLVGYASLKGSAAVTDVAYVNVADVLGPAGLLFGFVGLLGLYPRLAERSPILARIGAVCVSLGTASFAVITVVGVAILVGAASWSVPVAMLLLAAIGLIPGYLSFSLASLRAEQQFRAVGLLLLVPAIVFAAMLAQPFVYTAVGMFSDPTMAWSNFAISTGQAMAHLALAYTLRAAGTPHDQEAPSTDVSPS